MSSKIIIGIDQSYRCTGVALSYNGSLKSCTSIKTEHLKNNSEKRKELYAGLSAIFEKAAFLRDKYKCPVEIVIERIRLKSQGFLNIDYIKGIGALNALIADLAYEHGFPIYSVDTRAWKSAVVGTSKPKPNSYGFDPRKWPTILWCIGRGYEALISEHVSNKKEKGVVIKDGERLTYNDNTADAICISLYGFTPSPKLKEEH